MPKSNTAIREEERLLGPLICFILGAALAIAGIQGSPTGTVEASELDAATAPVSTEAAQPIQLPVSDELVTEPESRRGLAFFPIQTWSRLEIGPECVRLLIIEVEHVRGVDAPAG